MRAGLLLLLSGSLAMAQGTLPLSLPKAIEIALAPDGSARAALAQESIKQAESRKAQARSVFFPTIDSSVTERGQTVNLQAYGFEFPAIPGISIPSLVGPFGVFDARVSAQQSVLDLTNIRKFRASEAMLGAAKHESETARNQVAQQVARAYLSCLRTGASLEAAQANVDCPRQC